jgi:hypothetical protein
MNHGRQHDIEVPKRGRGEPRTICSLCAWPTNEEVVRFDVTIDQILLMYRLYTRDLRKNAQRRTRDTYPRAGEDAPFAAQPYTPS